MPPIGIGNGLGALLAGILISFLKRREGRRIIPHRQETPERLNDAENEDADDQPVQIRVGHEAGIDEMPGEADECGKAGQNEDRCKELDAHRRAQLFQPGLFRVFSSDPRHTTYADPTGSAPRNP